MREWVEPLEGRNCLSCSHCLWFQDYHEYRCELRGCYDYDKYQLNEGVKPRRTDNG